MIKWLMSKFKKKSTKSLGYESVYNCLDFYHQHYSELACLDYLYNSSNHLQSRLVYRKEVILKEPTSLVLAII